MLMRQRDFPKQIVVKDSIWEIRFVRKIHFGSAGTYTSYGLCDPGDKVVYIQMRQSPKERLVTFVHEVLHVFEEEYNIQLGHGIINKLQYPLAEFIVENCFIPLGVIPLE